MDEFKPIKRSMEVHLGVGDTEEIQKEIEDEQEVIQRICEEQGMV